jgi:hypothetical protein
MLLMQSASVYGFALQLEKRALHCSVELATMCTLKLEQKLTKLNHTTAITAVITVAMYRASQ